MLFLFLSESFVEERIVHYSLRLRSLPLPSFLPPHCSLHYYPEEMCSSSLNIFVHHIQSHYEPVVLNVYVPWFLTTSGVYLSENQPCTIISVIIVSFKNVYIEVLFVFFYLRYRILIFPRFPVIQITSCSQETTWKWHFTRK